MTRNRFYGAVDALYTRLRETQDENVVAAATLMAEAVAAGGCVHLFDTGHLVDSELLNRAGGLNIMRRFRYGLTVESTSRNRDESDKDKSMEGLADYALKASKVMPGDVMLIGSVSGKTVNVIDLAQACKRMGVKVVGLTSVGYSSQLDSMHSCGKRLYEIADVTLDNCAPFGDAMLIIEGIEAPALPASGMAAAYLCWAMCAELIDQLLAKGIVPGVLRSVNFPPNAAYNQTLYDQYNDKGY